jgi:hypothetical protein
MRFLMNQILVKTPRRLEGLKRSADLGADAMI